MFCVRPRKYQQVLFTIQKIAHFDKSAYRDDLFTDSICRNQADPERFPNCSCKRTKSHFQVFGKRLTRAKPISDNVTNLPRRVEFSR